jgi:hypothetical protein
MGVERAVTRWYVQRQSLLDELASLEAKLTQMQAEGQGKEPESKERADIERQLAGVKVRLRALGPCPKPMMG